jgi:hypothetical protein
MSVAHLAVLVVVVASRRLPPQSSAARRPLAAAVRIIIYSFLFIYPLFNCFYSLFVLSTCGETKAGAFFPS